MVYFIKSSLHSFVLLLLLLLFIINPYSFTLTAKPLPCEQRLLCDLPTPDIYILDDVMGTCEATVMAPTATDPCDASTIVGTTSDPLIYSSKGIYTVTWIYGGMSGSVTQEQTVIVDDGVPPSFSCNGNIPTGTITLCEYVLLDYTSNVSNLSDNCGTVNVTQIPIPGTIIKKTTLVALIVDDGNGNTSTCSFFITMKTQEPIPEEANLPVLISGCGIEIVDFPIARNICDEEIIGTTLDPLMYFEEGSYTVNWIFEDSIGGMSSQTQIVEIIGLPETVEVINACKEYEHEGILYTTSQIITDTIFNPNECDVLHKIDLIIHQYHFVEEEVIEICGSFESPSGKIFNTSGIHIDTLASPIGCDTILTFDLTITSSHEYSFMNIVCADFMGPDSSIISSTGTYIFNVPGPAGCDSIITVDLFVVDDLSANVEVEADSLVADWMPEGITYQWINCATNENIAGANEQVFMPELSGEYSVSMSFDGCSTTSECIEFDLVSSDSEYLISNRINSYPNPFNQYLNIDLGKTIGIVEISLFDASGKLVFIEMLNNINKYSLSSKALSDGVYFLQLKSESEIYRSKVIKYSN